MAIATAPVLTVTLRSPHPQQALILGSTAKRIIVRAGRRSGKTVLAATMSLKEFLEGGRPLYAVPTAEQLDAWWYEVKRALAEPIRAGVFVKNEVEHSIELAGGVSTNRLRGKTAWNPDTLRGDWASKLFIDEWQLMAEETWDLVGAPMLLDHDGAAVFFYTPPSLRSAGVSKARDPRHAAKMFTQAREDKTGRWAAFSFTSHDNPHISKDALAEITQDMTQAAYRQEILAEDDELQVSGLVYGAFKDKVCLIPRFPIPSSWLIYSGHDFGGANPAALFVAQDPATGNFYEFAEYLPGAGRSTNEHVEEFKRLTAGRTVLWRSGGSHQEEEIRQGYAAHGWPIMEPKVKGLSAQVDKVIGAMERNKIFIFSDLFRRREELANCLWAIDNTGQRTDKIEHEERYHLCACARYLYSGFTPETAGFPGLRARVVRTAA